MTPEEKEIARLRKVAKVGLDLYNEGRKFLTALTLVENNVPFAESPKNLKKRLVKVLEEWDNLR